MPSPVTLTDVLPAGLRAVSISAHVPKGYAVNESVPIACSLEKLTCTVEGTYEVNADGTHEVLPKDVPRSARSKCASAWSWKAPRRARRTG